ncbi:IS200/IS605 family transposase [Salinibacter sp.]|uniref:IS200/IS605 family transposase n=1 Tax=Salinibacter sp. TaxID=2065818 RepID=UPI0021E975D7|nr:IS200/IS605 family transposase [Salinibacter sp.]
MHEVCSSLLRVHESAIDGPPGRAGRYSPVGRSLDGCFRLKKRRFVVRLLVCQRDEPAIRFTLAEYHLVWAPKYRKWILRGDIQDRVEELFREIGEQHDIEIDTLEVAEDHVHLFVSFPPRLSISEVVGKMKAISAKVVFEEFPEAEREMYGGEFWEDGYFARTVGDEVTTKVIRRYIEYHDEEETRPDQLDLFDQ